MISVQYVCCVLLFFDLQPRVVKGSVTGNIWRHSDYKPTRWAGEFSAFNCRSRNKWLPASSGTVQGNLLRCIYSLSLTYLSLSYLSHERLRGAPPALVFLALPFRLLHMWSCCIDYSLHLLCVCSVFFLSVLLWITPFVVCYFSHPYSAYFHESLKVLAAAIQAQSIFTDRLLVDGFLINKWPIVCGQRRTHSGSALILNSNAAVNTGDVCPSEYLTVTIMGRFRQQGSGGPRDWTYWQYECTSVQVH